MSKYCLINNSAQNHSLIRNEFQKALRKTNFIEDILGDGDITISEPDKENDIRQQLILKEDASNLNGLWKINLEAEIAGISSKNTSKTPEVAILALTHKEGHSSSTLHVLLIELKTTLVDSSIKSGTDKYKPSTLEQCHDKFKAAMNRLYMLLSLNEHRNDSNYSNKTIIVNFKGIVCYTKSAISRSEDSMMYKIFNKAPNNILNCTTILNDNDKIEIHFIDTKGETEVIKNLSAFV